MRRRLGGGLAWIVLAALTVIGFARSSSGSHSRNPALGGESMTLVLAQVRRVVAGLLPLAVVTGCASTDLGPAAKAQLERAQIAYRQAQADPNVQSYAQLRLSEA